MEARLTIVSLQAKAPAITSDEPYDVDPAAHTCTCADWVYKPFEIGAGEIGPRYDKTILARKMRSHTLPTSAVTILSQKKNKAGQLA